MPFRSGITEALPPQALRSGYYGAFLGKPVKIPSAWGVSTSGLSQYRIRARRTKDAIISVQKPFHDCFFLHEESPPDP